MGSHRVTCHPTEAASPTLTPAESAGTRFMVRRTFVVLAVSHYLLLFLAKNHNYMFEFVKVMPKVLSVPFFVLSVVEVC